MYRIDSIATLLQKQLLKKLRHTALWIGLGAGTLFAGQLPAPLAGAPDTGIQMTANQRVKTATEADSWIVVLAGEPLAAKQDRSKQGAARAQAVTAQKQQLKSIRERFLAQAGPRGKAATAAAQPTRTFETLIHGVVMHGNKADAGRWADQADVLGVYPNRRLQLAPLEKREAAKAKAKAAKVNYDGEGQVIAILDTGIDYTHPDLGGGFGPDYKVIGGYDFVADDADPMDEHYHGTHVAGIAAADGTMQGMAPKAKLLAYRVLDEYGFGTDATLIAGLEAAVDPDADPSTDDGADVINISLGGPGDADDPASRAVDQAVAAGAVVVVAAGNDGSTAWSIGSPGAARDAVTVGAVDADGALTWYSSFGPAKPDVPKPDISALGDIESTIPGGGYLFEMGTSMAAPAVAGAAALLRQANPNLDPAAVKSMLQAGAEPIVDHRYYQQGSGILNIEKSLQTAVTADAGLINFGRLDHAADSFNRQRTLSFTNRGDQPVTIAIPSLPEAAGLAVTVSPAEQQVNPGQQATFTVTLAVNNTAWPYQRDHAYFDERRLAVHLDDHVQYLPITAAKFLTFSVSPAQPWVQLGQYSLVNEAGQTVTTDYLDEGRTYYIEPGNWDLLVSGWGNNENNQPQVWFQNFKGSIHADAAFELNPNLCRIPFAQTIIDFEGKPVVVDASNRISGVYARYVPGQVDAIQEPGFWEADHAIMFSNWPVNHDLILHENVDLGGNRIAVLPTTASGCSDGTMPVYDLRQMAKLELDVDMANSEELYNRNHLTLFVMSSQGDWQQAHGIYHVSKDQDGNFNPNQAQGGQKVTLFLPGPDQTRLPQTRTEPISHLSYQVGARLAAVDMLSSEHQTPFFTVADDLRLVKVRFTDRYASVPTDTAVADHYILNGPSLFANFGLTLTENGLDYLFPGRQQGGAFQTPNGSPVRVPHLFSYEKDGVLLGTNREGFRLTNPKPGNYRITLSGVAETYAAGKDLTLIMETKVGANGPTLFPAPVLQNLTWDGHQGTLYFYDRVAAHNYESYQSDTQPTGFDPKPITVEAAVRPLGGGTWTALTVRPRGDQPGVFTFEAPTPALGQTLSLRVRATDPNGDRTTYESPAYFQRGVVQELPAPLGEDNRFGLLTLTNHGDSATEVILVATDGDGREAQRSVRLGVGAVKPLLPAALFTEMRDYRLRLLADSHAVTMTFKNGLGTDQTEAKGQNREQLSQGQSLLNLPFNAAAELQVSTLFPAGVPARTSTARVDLWDENGRQGETTVELVEGRPTTSALGDLFPDYTGEGPISLRLVSNEGHKLQAGLRDGKGWTDGVAEHFGWDNRRFYAVPAHKHRAGTTLSLLNRRYTQLDLQLRAVSLENGATWTHTQDLAPGMTTLTLSEMVPFAGAYQLEISNFHNQVHTAISLGEGADAIRIPALDGLDLSPELSFDGFSVLQDMRLVISAPDSTVDNEVVLRMHDAFGREVEKVFTLKAGQPRVLRSADLLRLGFPQLDGTRLTLTSSQNANLTAFGIEGGLFKKLRVTTARRR